MHALWGINCQLANQGYGFSSSHVWMWELDYKESWAPKNWCFWPVVLEETLESPLDSKEIKPVNPKGNKPWILIGRTDAEAEAPILWPPDAKSQLTGKDPNAGKDWRQEEKGITEDEKVGCHHQLNGHEFEQTLGDGEGQGSLVCCSLWGCKELDMTEQLNNDSRWVSSQQASFKRWINLTVLSMFIHFMLMLEGSQWKCMCTCSLAQLCPTLCDAMDWSPPGSSVHEIL